MNSLQKFQKAIGMYADPFYRDALPAAVRLGEEAGEVQGVVKRIERGVAYNGRLKSPEARREALAGELGDVLSSIACLCEVYRMDMSEIADAQIKKEASKACGDGRV